MKTTPRIQLLRLQTALVLMVCTGSAALAEPAKPPADDAGFLWKSEVPEGCPFEPSPTLTGVYFTGRHSDYRCGDTFYPSWASDGNLYSPWTDGMTDGVKCGSGKGANAETGHAVMIGDDPLKLEIRNTSPPKIASALPYRGRYPCGSLVHDGIWYYGTYCLGPAGSFKHRGFTWNWPNLGPMPGFQISRDLGKTWEPSPLSPAEPLFPEPEKFLGPVKMGAPHFVDFGKNMEHSPDGKAYLLGQGAVVEDPEPRPCIKPVAGGGFETQACDEDFDHANLSWITADQIYLARVTPSPETINDIKAYEFFAGHDSAGKPLWTANFAEIKPLIEWNNRMGCALFRSGRTRLPGWRSDALPVSGGRQFLSRLRQEPTFLSCTRILLGVNFRLGLVAVVWEGGSGYDVGVAQVDRLGDRAAGGRVGGGDWCFAGGGVRGSAVGFQ